MQPKRPPRQFQTVEKAVCMTHAQQERQNLQAQWLTAAIAAQNTKPAAALDLSSLRG